MAQTFAAKWLPGVVTSFFQDQNGNPVWEQRSRDGNWQGSSSIFSLPDIITGDRVVKKDKSDGLLRPLSESYSLRLADYLLKQTPTLQWAQEKLYWPDGKLAASRAYLPTQPAETGIPKLNGVRSPFSVGQQRKRYVDFYTRRINDVTILDSMVENFPLWQPQEKLEIGTTDLFVSEENAAALAEKSFSGLYLNPVPTLTNRGIINPPPAAQNGVYTVHWPSNAVNEGWKIKPKLLDIRAKHLKSNRHSFIKYTDYELGDEIDERTVPSQWIYGSSRRHFPAIMPGGLSYTVSQAAKELIENLEPDIHQFFPLQYVTRKGDHITNRWALNVRTSIDSLDRKCSDPARSELWYSERRYRRKLLIDRAATNGYHLWFEKWRRSLFISYELAIGLSEIDFGMNSFGFFGFSNAR